MAVTIQQIAQGTDQSGGGREDLSSGGRDGIRTERAETFQNS